MEYEEEKHSPSSILRDLYFDQLRGENASKGAAAIAARQTPVTRMF